MELRSSPKYFVSPISLRLCIDSKPRATFRMCFTLQRTLTSRIHTFGRRLVCSFFTMFSSYFASITRHKSQAMYRVLLPKGFCRIFDGLFRSPCRKTTLQPMCLFRHVLKPGTPERNERNRSAGTTGTAGTKIGTTETKIGTTSIR